MPDHHIRYIDRTKAGLPVYLTIPVYHDRQDSRQTDRVRLTKLHTGLSRSADVQADRRGTSTVKPY